MSMVAPHIIYDEDKTILAHVHPASQDAVDLVLSASIEGNEGRSNWIWVRLPNGDLILGVFPQGDTYLECEEDSSYP